MMIFNMFDMGDMLSCSMVAMPIEPDAIRMEPTCSCASGSITDMDGRQVCQECGTPYED